jgi:hypothetical protein
MILVSNHGKLAAETIEVFINKIVINTEKNAIKKRFRGFIKIYYFK